MRGAGPFVGAATGKQCGVSLKTHRAGLRQVGARARVQPGGHGQEGRGQVWGAKGGSPRRCEGSVVLGPGVRGSARAKAGARARRSAKAHTRN